MSIQNVDETTFASLSKSGMCVVKFGAQWCAPCKFIGPRLESAQGKLPSTIKFLGIDVDECSTLVQSMALHKVPTVIVMKSGVEVARHEGLASEADLLDLVQRHL